jgi:hypothetical protein
MSGKCIFVDLLLAAEIDLPTSKASTSDRGRPVGGGMQPASPPASPGQQFHAYPDEIPRRLQRPLTWSRTNVKHPRWGPRTSMRAKEWQMHPCFGIEFKCPSLEWKELMKGLPGRRCWRTRIRYSTTDPSSTPTEPLAAAIGSSSPVLEGPARAATSQPATEPKRRESQLAAGRAEQPGSRSRSSIARLARLVGGRTDSPDRPLLPTRGKSLLSRRATQRATSRPIARHVR